MESQHYDRKIYSDAPKFWQPKILNTNNKFFSFWPKQWGSISNSPMCQYLFNADNMSAVWTYFVTPYNITQVVTTVNVITIVWKKVGLSG